VGDDSHVVFGKRKFPAEEGSVRWCIVVMQQQVWGTVFIHFHAVAPKHHSNMQNSLFGLPGQILSEQSP
jgi:hypothetical protein